MYFFFGRSDSNLFVSSNLLITDFCGTTWTSTFTKNELLRSFGNNTTDKIYDTEFVLSEYWIATYT